MVKLRRLKIERFRNVEPCDLTFSDGLNVVLGQNGAGKTTLLNFVSKVLRTNLADTSDPFAIEIELVFPGGALSGRVAMPDQEVPLAPVEGMEEVQDLNRFQKSGVRRLSVPEIELVARYEGSGATVAITSLGDAVKFQINSNSVEYIFSLSAHLLIAPSGLLARLFSTIARYSVESGATQTILPVRPSLGEVQRFDEGLDMYRSIVAKAEDAIIFDPELRPIFTFERWQHSPAWTFLGRIGLLAEGLRSAAAKYDISAEVMSMALPVERLAFLQAFVRLLNLESAEARFELLEKTGNTTVEHMHFGNLKFWFTRKDGSIFQDHQLSYGQKRLLTFLYYLDANPSFVIADELVNGMHHRWIEESVRAIGERQAFLTSQNPLLLDYLTFESIEQVKSSFVVCRTELHEGRERMIWRNFTDDEADMFFRAYRVGIEHVGEILRTRGLW